MEREKLNKEITALYCRLSKADKQNGESMSISTQKEKHKRAIKQCKARINEIDDLYAQLYEDLSKELIPERRFKMMTDRLDKEQLYQRHTLR